MANQQQKAVSVNDLYPKKEFLAPSDLNGRSFKLQISGVEVYEYFDTRFGAGKTAKALIHFRKAKKPMLLNRTQAKAVAEIAASELLPDWIGTAIVITAGRASNGKPTILIRAATAAEEM